MKKVIQIIFYSASFVVVLFMGNFFDEECYEAGFRAKHLLGDKPLPLLSQFLIEHHHLPAHLTLLPWLCLVGAPLLTLNAARNYWDPQSFMLRYLAFLSCELVLLLVLLLGLAMPFLSIDQGMHPARESAIENVVRWSFWVGFVVVIFAACRRAQQIRNDRNT